MIAPATATLTLCTRNGGERLRTCLAHIDALDWDEPLELFLIDNASDDGVSLPMLERFAATTRFDARVRRTAIPGNSAGRNVAVREATGDIHIFIDDDCYVAPDFIRAWMQAFATSDVGFGSGMVTRHDLRFSDLGCVEHPDERRLEARTFIWRGFVQGSNMAFRRECLEAAGGFDERLGAGTPYAGEEWDVALRAARAGWAGGYFPQARVAHDHRRTSEQAAARMHFYDFGGGVIYAKNTFVRGGFESVKELRREFRRLIRGGEPRRILPFLQGYLAYFAKLAGGRGGRTGT